jgi:hypothetical protein
MIKLTLPDNGRVIKRESESVARARAALMETES